jgi:GPN-loop GTPase
MASSASAATPAAAPGAPDATTKPTAIVCVGMAGSGKTTFMQRINAHLHGQKDPPYVINLDPAVLNVPFESNIDIRDSVNYKEVMKQYNLGPNGGILTSLNLFATKVDQIVGLLEKRAAGEDGKKKINNILVDTRKSAVVLETINIVELGGTNANLSAQLVRSRSLCGPHPVRSCSSRSPRPSRL